MRSHDNFQNNFNESQTNEKNPFPNLVDTEIFIEYDLDEFHLNILENNVCQNNDYESQTNEKNPFPNPIDTEIFIERELNDLKNIRRAFKIFNTWYNLVNNKALDTAGFTLYSIFTSGTTGKTPSHIKQYRDVLVNVNKMRSRSLDDISYILRNLIRIDMDLSDSDRNKETLQSKCYKIIHCDLIDLISQDSYDDIERSIKREKNYPNVSIIMR